MKDRIKELRKYLKMSQTEFADSIKISRSALSKIESGENTPSEQTIELIVSKHKANEEWLKNGTGEMFIHNADNLSGYLDKLIDSDADFIKDIIKVYMDLDDTSRDALKEIAKRFVEQRTRKGS